jgi:hypothetical protein
VAQGNQNAGVRRQEISAYTNGDGMRAAVVVATRGGFNVVLQDLDSGEYIPSVANYTTFERADFAAQEMVAK